MRLWPAWTCTALPSATRPDSSATRPDSSSCAVTLDPRPAGVGRACPSQRLSDSVFLRGCVKTAGLSNNRVQGSVSLLSPSPQAMLLLPRIIVLSCWSERRVWWRVWPLSVCGALLSPCPVHAPAAPLLPLSAGLPDKSCLFRKESSQLFSRAGKTGRV